MSARSLVALVAVVPIGLLLALPAAGQAQARAADDSQFQTPWGHPDLQGVWDYRTITPLERPEEGIVNLSEIGLTDPPHTQFTTGSSPSS